MRTNLLMLAAAIVLIGCSTSSHYRKAADELHVTEAHVLCWAPITDQPADGQCDFSKATELEETTCVDTLASTRRRPLSLELAKREIEGCMQAKGWHLQPINIAIAAPDVREAADCAKQYGWERCPQMPAPTP